MLGSLVLSPADRVASGVQRVIYLHPTDPGKLIKILKPSSELKHRTNFNGVMDRWFPGTRLRQIRKEYGEYVRVMLNNPDPDFRAPISHMYGFVATNLGLGCLTERIRNRDGSLGQTLSTKAKAGTLTDEDIDLLNDTVARLFHYNIRASDMNPSNFVFGYRADDTGTEQMECVLVDGFGDIHAVPVRSMAKWSNHLGLDDSCKRLTRHTKLVWDSKRRQFSRS
ncbi:YrbL family protein [Yoonia sp.]|uniref:YrbL family protein n=1 Tax=Yoonia sp. TaxID=2212373 RepID=UPI00358E056A